jgi:8-oxo-dGTP pyrophosphatase MutT (NUDIX family)
MELIEQIRGYEPFNEQEARDKAGILKALESQPDIFGRENTIAHMTASAWVLDDTRQNALMAFHNIYHSWSWLGGHADGQRDLLAVALKEVQEESGLTAAALSEGIFSLEILTVDGHVKNGRYVSSHLHLNVTYLLEAPHRAELHYRPQENQAVAWFPLGEVISASSEPWFRQHIYAKLNEKLAAGGWV